MLAWCCSEALLLREDPTLIYADEGRGGKRGGGISHGQSRLT